MATFPTDVATREARATLRFAFDHVPCAVETQHALPSIKITKAMRTQRRASRGQRRRESDSSLSVAAGRQRALDDAAGAAGAEELAVIKSAENMVCTGVCGRERSQTG
jgi:hypothetical protein